MNLYYQTCRHAYLHNSEPPGRLPRRAIALESILHMDANFMIALKSFVPTRPDDSPAPAPGFRSRRAIPRLLILHDRHDPPPPHPTNALMAGVPRPAGSIPLLGILTSLREAGIGRRYTTDRPMMRHGAYAETITNWIISADATQMRMYVYPLDKILKWSHRPGSVMPVAVVHEPDLGRSARVDAIMSRSHSRAYVSHLKNGPSSAVNTGLIGPGEPLVCIGHPAGIETVAGQLSFWEHDRAAAADPSDSTIVDRTEHFSLDRTPIWAGLTYAVVRRTCHLLTEAAALLVAGPVNQPPVWPTVVVLCTAGGSGCNARQCVGGVHHNNVAVAVEAIYHWRQFCQMAPDDRARIMVLDLGARHAAGTQAIYWDRDDVATVSIHVDRGPLDPGRSELTGGPSSSASNLNITLPAGAGFGLYMDAVARACSAADRYLPTYLILVLGFDTHEREPDGPFRLQTEDYKHVAAMLRSNGRFLNIPVLIIIETGSNQMVVGPSCVGFLEGWRAADEIARDNEWCECGSCRAMMAGLVNVEDEMI